MKAALRSIGDALGTSAVRRPRSALALAVVVFAAALGALSQLRPVTDLTQILKTPAALAYERVAQRFGLSERAFVLIESGEDGRSAALIRAAEGLARELATAAEIERVEYDLPMSSKELADELVLPFGPLYFGPEELDGLSRRLDGEGQRAQLEKQLQLAGLPGLGVQDEWIQSDPLDFHRPLVRRLGSLRGDYRLAADARHFLSVDGRALLVTATAALPATSTSGAARTIDSLEAAIATVAATPDAHGLSFGITGAHALARESERVIRRDLTVSLSISLFLAFAILAITLGIRGRSIVWIVLPTLWGTTVGIGAFVALEPALAALSLGAAAILIGLGIDFTIHFIVEARASQADQADPTAAIEQAGKTVFGRLAFATATSSAAFLAFRFCEQSFLRDMGAIAVLGLIGCFVGAYLVLPPILQRVLPHLGVESSFAKTLTCAIAGTATRHSRAVLVLAGLSVIASGAILFRSPPRFEDDLRNIHAKGSPALAVQERIASAFGGSLEPLLVLIEGQDEQGVLAACQRLEPSLDELRASGLLTSRTSPAALIPPLATQRAVLERLSEHDPDQVVTTFREALDDVGFAPEAFEDYAQRLRAAVARREPVTLAALRNAGLGRVVDGMARPGESTEQGAAALVVLYPTRDLWSFEARTTFVEAVRSALQDAQVSGAITGLHQISSETANEIQQDFRRILGLTFGLVLVLMVLRFRSPGRTVLVLVPTVLGSLWTAAAFSLLDARLNFMNLSVLPMVFAIGIDDGIHLLSCFSAQRERSVERVFATTGVAVLLTSLTTMITFGSLSLSANRGLASVGTLSWIGVGGCLVASIVVLPALFHQLRPRNRT